MGQKESPHEAHVKLDFQHAASEASQFYERNTASKRRAENVTDHDDYIFDAIVTFLSTFKN